MTRLSQFPKPDAGQYAGKRKLFLVPNVTLGPDADPKGKDILNRYWAEVRDHVQNLERTLGAVSHIYHEMLYRNDEEGMKILENLNPYGLSFIETLRGSTATLEATEDPELVHQSMDWQRCISMGLASTKVLTTAIEGHQEAISGRFEHIGSRIDETLGAGESGILFVREDHRVQFPTDIQVFYVAPPSLDGLKRWLDERMRAETTTSETENGG